MLKPKKATSKVETQQEQTTLTHTRIEEDTKPSRFEDNGWHGEEQDVGCGVGEEEALDVIALLGLCSKRYFGSHCEASHSAYRQLAVSAFFFQVNLPRMMILLALRQQSVLRRLAF